MRAHQHPKAIKYDELISQASQQSIVVWPQWQLQRDRRGAIKLLKCFASGTKAIDICTFQFPSLVWDRSPQPPKIEEWCGVMQSPVALTTISEYFYHTFLHSWVWVSLTVCYAKKIRVGINQRSLLVHLSSIGLHLELGSCGSIVWNLPTHPDEEDKFSRSPNLKY